MPWNDRRPPTLGVDVGNVLVEDLLEHGVDAPLITGAVEALRSLNLEVMDRRTHLISKAGPKVQRLTMDWLEHTRLLSIAEIPEGNLHFVREDRDKAAICRRLGISHMIDDKVAVHRHLDGVAHRYLFGADAVRPVPAGHPLRGMQAVADWPAAADLVTRSVRASPPSDLPRRLDVRAMSAPEARQWTAAWHPAAVLSVVNEPDDAILCDAEHLIVCFGDVASGYEAMTIGQAHQIVEFLRLLSDSDRLLIHCRGGIGRSPAVAIAALVAVGAPPPEAVAQVRERRPQATPNPHVIHLFDEALGCAGDLEAAVETGFGMWKPRRLR